MERIQASPLARRLRTVALAVATSGALLLSALPAAAQSKIAVVDVRRAVLETEQGLRVQATLKKLFDSRQVELDSKQRQLQTDKDAFDKKAQSGKTPQNVLQKDAENLQKAAAELQNVMVEYQREMQRRESEMTAPILQGVLEAVKRIAAQDGYEMVLDKSSVPYFRGDLELTDRAIQMVNSGQPGGGAKPAGPGGKGAPAGSGAPPVKGAVGGSAPAPAPAKPPAKK